MSVTAGPNWAFRMMALIHDNIFLRKWSDPQQTLRNAGIKEGQTVLEVGCGPGFFTIPAANIIGDSGKLYALDIHPLAERAITKKVQKNNLHNVEIITEDITHTSFVADMFDLVFLFGVPRMLKSDPFLMKLLLEMRRLLKPGGILSVKTKREQVIQKCENVGFDFKYSNCGILIFINKG